MSDNNVSLKDASHKQLAELNAILLVYTGQKFETQEDATENYIAYMPFLKRSYGNYKVEEIKLAFQLAREGKLLNEDGKTFKLFRELNYASACDVMIAYENYKKDKIGLFVRNQSLYVPEENLQLPQINEKLGMVDILKHTWELFNEDKYNAVTGAFLYDYLKSINLIDLSDSEKINVQMAAGIEYQNVLIAKKQSAVRKERTTIGEEIDLLSKYLFENEEEKIDEQKTEEIKKKPGFVRCCKYIAVYVQIEKWAFESISCEEINTLILEN